MKTFFIELILILSLINFALACEINSNKNLIQLELQEKQHNKDFLKSRVDSCTAQTPCFISIDI